ncbi:hypothetical protein BH10CYA1_BH10CYA1_34860 [soil metagenome]
MTSPFQPERSELPQPGAAGGNGLNTEYANLMQSTQKSSADNPQVMSADGSQMVIPPIGQTSADQNAASGTAGKTAAATDAQQPATEQGPQSVAYNPSLNVPMWQRFSPTPVATDGSMMPADGPGSPGDPGPGPPIPMWMRFAPPGSLSNQQTTDQTSTASNELASQNKATAQTDATTTPTTTTTTASKRLPGGQTGPLVT